MIYICVTLGIVVVLVVAFKLFVLWHIRWLAQQSPAGAWVASLDTGTVTIQFDGGPHEGLYMQITETEDGAEREFGSWCAYLGKLDLLIMAADRQEHPRFGVGTEYAIRYVGPASIVISGPDRPDVRYERAPEGTNIAVKPEDIPNNAGSGD